MNDMKQIIYSQKLHLLLEQLRPELNRFNDVLKKMLQSNGYNKNELQSLITLITNHNELFKNELFIECGEQVMQILPQVIELLEKISANDELRNVYIEAGIIDEFQHLCDKIIIVFNSSS